MCRGDGGAATGSTNPRPQASSSPAASRNSSSSQREEQAVPHRPGPPPAAPEPLQERGHRQRRVHLDHPVQVTDVDAQLERGGGHDHAVAALGERLLGAPPLVKRQRRVHQVRGDAARAQFRAEHLDEPLGVREHQPLLTPVQRRDDLGRVRHA